MLWNGFDMNLAYNLTFVYNYRINFNMNLVLFMNKDKEKNRSVSESITANDPKNSSTAAALLQLSKEKENIKEAQKRESADEAAKVRCPVCFKETAPKRLCFGHGSNGGGGSNGATSDKTSEENANPGEDNFLNKPRELAETTDEVIGESNLESLDEKSFDPEIIAELLAKGLLLINNDRESMTLNIKLQCEPNTLTEKQRHELKKFMEAIIKEFHEFKKENHLSDDCIKITQDEKGNILSLRITMPTLALYDAFIQQLANNLIPSPSPKIRAEDEATKGQRCAPNPFSMEPKPSSYAREKVEENENEEQEIFNPSPFKTNPW